jgi:hypothetical protein
LIDRARSRCTVFQIFFDPVQRGSLDTAFVPYDNGGRTTERLEFDVFRRLAASSSVQSMAHWGAVSWRFYEKTGIRGRELLSVVRAAPNIDLWFCNPYPYLEALFPSYWYQGHTTHPGLGQIAREFFTMAALPAQDLDRFEPASHFSAANYFVGSPRFWESYLPFVTAMLEKVDQGASPEWRERLRSPEADPKRWHRGAGYLPFIIERLLPTFLRGPGAHLAVRRYPVPREEAKLNDELRTLRIMKDQAIAQRSVDLAREWMERRNRYVIPRCKPEWWAEFGDFLTSREIVF